MWTYGAIPPVRLANLLARSHAWELSAYCALPQVWSLTLGLSVREWLDAHVAVGTVYRSRHGMGAHFFFLVRLVMTLLIELLSVRFHLSAMAFVIFFARPCV